MLKIPNAALRFTPYERKSASSASSTSSSTTATEGTAKRKGPGVWVMENDKPKRIHVKTGISDGNYTELADGDLKEGQELLLESLGKQKSSSGGSHGPRMF